MLIQNNVSFMDEIDWYRYHPIHEAINYEKKYLVKLFLTCNNIPNVNGKVDGDNFALMMAVQKGNAEIVKILLKHKADINMKIEKTGETALHYVCSIPDGGLDIMRLLLLNRAEVCPKNSEGKTPFALMEQQGDEDRIKLMLRHIMALYEKTNRQPRARINDEKIIEKNRIWTNYFKQCEAELPTIQKQFPKSSWIGISNEK
ncbi:GA-binding protein subunit beta-1-like isoform X1 [Nasonia vitripennis]|uniref:Uncharacterized protein n=1 Tax=Nasonia vitripennis TaxID=7425 RepID=A0A7M7H8P5_NASVI|nr:GA-binding protein subunit beta-1-like isoform X1 [Nasonia vitripennis]